MGVASRGPNINAIRDCRYQRVESTEQKNASSEQRVEGKLGCQQTACLTMFKQWQDTRQHVHVYVSVKFSKSPISAAALPCTGRDCAGLALGAVARCAEAHQCHN